MAWLPSLSCQFRRYGREDTRLGRARSRAESDPLADRAEAEARSIRMAGYGGPAQPPPRSGNALMGQMVA
jgi:hypothetical protein